jgi:ATP-dependent Clp protease ATP-binding subunit ClpX
LRLVNPDDLMRFGMIPEIVGRLPVTISVDPLDITSLRAILTKPRNALVRQYQRLFEMDDVELQFTPAALDAAAGSALERETGARGLRAIIEGALLDVMYEIPSRPEIQTVEVDEDAITGAGRPRLLNAKGKALPFGDEILSDAA